MLTHVLSIMLSHNVEIVESSGSYSVCDTIPICCLACSLYPADIFMKKTLLSNGIFFLIPALICQSQAILLHVGEILYSNKGEDFRGFQLHDACT